MKVVQFGEGAFLRGFVDWMFNSLQCEVVVVQPIKNGMLEVLAKQHYKYNLLLRGIENKKSVQEKLEISCIKDGINPYTDWNKFLSLAQDKDVKVIVSNTTESGIEYKQQKIADAPEVTFPAKLTLFLKSRYDAGLNPLLILPCELIDNNGDKLLEYILKYASDWNFDNGFISWIKSNHFCNTLVDRIVTGYPRDMDTQGDNMFNTAEIFHLWVIEGNYENILPLKESGFNVIWTDDATPYKKRKVRILNGAHTALVPYAMLRGFTTVRECVMDEQIKSYITKCIFDEIIPTLDLPKEELTNYADSVLERFSNPHINHLLSSIALNSFDKFKVRVMPSILEYERRFGTKPPTLMKSFDALYEFYKTDMVSDADDVVQFVRNSTKEEVWERLC